MDKEKQAVKERIAKHKAMITHIMFAIERIEDWNEQVKANYRGFRDTDSFRKWKKAAEDKLKEDRLALVELNGD